MSYTRSRVGGGQRAFMARVHRLEHVQGLAAIVVIVAAFWLFR